jgi:alpha-tubulin suppressor-like RCC1 family protein
MGRLALVRGSYAAITLAFAAPACGGSAGKDAQAPARASEASPSSAREEAKAPSGPPVALDCGDFTSCAVAQGGEVRCWGRDKTGELGDGGGADRPKAVAVPGVEKATKVAMASQFACALLEDRRVACWGSGRIAADGKPVTNGKPLFVEAAKGALELAASGVIACARTPTEVICWGADASTIGAPPKGAFTQIATGFTHACALDKAGSVTCWGTGDWAPNGAFGKPALKGATYVATGDRHACVIAKDKRVMCWGQNDAGQLGTKPDATAHKTPAAVPSMSNAVRLVAGEASTCALLADGTARCWGANAEGERPTSVSVSPLAEICIGTTHGCALTKTGTIHCWGGNAHGQLGDGTTAPHLAAAPVAW